MLLFISPRHAGMATLCHSNTSHVIVYHIAGTEVSGLNKHSNTSHVIVYLYEFFASTYAWEIQIHLMLLFIAMCEYAWTDFDNSNTSHVIVYHCRRPSATHYKSIQIHLMLLFIPHPTDGRS